MTAQQEVRFRCNRCLEETNLPLQNVPTVDRIMKGPDGWVTLWIDDQTSAPYHLCPACSSGFQAYMTGTPVLHTTMFAVTEELRTDPDAAP